jgi:hypothetical protein
MKKVKNFILSLFLSLSLVLSPTAKAVDLVLEVFDVGFDITNSIDTGYEAVSGAIKQVYQGIIQNEAVITTINTYKSFLEAAKIYKKTVYLLNILQGNPGFSDLMRVAGDRDIRNLMGEDWSEAVNDIDAFENSISGTDRRIRNAFSSFERGHIPYQSDLIYIDRRLNLEKELYEKNVSKNKMFYVNAESAISRSEEKIFKMDRMEAASDATDNPKERDSLRNQFQIEQYRELAEANRTLSMVLLQKNEEIKKEMNARAYDKIMANTDEFVI